MWREGEEWVWRGGVSGEGGVGVEERSEWGGEERRGCGGEEWVWRRGVSGEGSGGEEWVWRGVRREKGESERRDREP